MQELLFAARSLLRRRTVTATAVLSVALAIGAGACAFSVVDAIRFRALPFADPDGLIVLSEVAAGEKPTASYGCHGRCSLTYASLSTVLQPRHLRSVSSIAAFAVIGKVLTRDGRADGVVGAVATPGLFTALRAAPILGRALSAEDDRVGAPPVMLLSYAFWASRFGADTALLGTTLQLSETHYTVIGVMPPGFDFESGANYWLPLAPVEAGGSRASIGYLTTIARLAPGATIEQARAEVTALEPAATGPGPRTQFGVVPLRERYETATQGNDLIFLAVVGCILLIAATNLSNLFLLRALDQQRDAAVRAALGASRTRLVTQALLQHALVVAAGTAVGLALAAWAIPLVGSATVLNSFRPTGMAFRLDWRVAGTAVAAALAVLGLVSIVPARLLAREHALGLLRAGAATMATTRGRLQRAFVVVQLAASVVLLVAAGLEVRTVQRLARLDLGFDLPHLVQGIPSYPPSWRVPATYVPVTRRILDDMRALPGVDAVAVQASVRTGASQFTPMDHAAPLPRADAPEVLLIVTAGYFGAAHVAMTRGRAFTDDDREHTEPVAVVNEWAAAHWWPGADPVGKTIRIDTAAGQGTTVRVVGVARANRSGGFGLAFATDGPALYRPFEQAPLPFPAFLAHTAMAPATIVRPLRDLLAREVPDRPLYVQPLSEIADGQLSGVRVVALQVAAIAAVGFFLAIVGIYGVVAFSVSRRTREFGIRRALGASAASVLAMVVREALVVSILAIVLGSVGARFLGRALGPLLHGTDPADPAAWTAAVAVVVIATVAFALLPARRAARIAPVTALRAE